MSQLDQLVKGAPDPTTTTTRVAAAAASNPPSLNAATALLSHNSTHPHSAHAHTSSSSTRALARQNSHSSTTDPLLSTLPSSPPQIYLNLLILEASLRAQYLSLLARRRIHTFFLVVLLACLSYSTHLLFFRQREDGRGQGGSPYWVLDTLIKLFWLGALLTALLTWATGLWERGMRWPRRWANVTNRGLRGMNLKVVVLKGHWLKRGIGQVLGPLLAVVYLVRPGSASVGSFQWMVWPERESKVDGGKFAYRDGSVKVGRGAGMQGQVLKEEDVAEGGDVLRLMLLPKAFSAEFREGWEKWRDEYWEKENARRGDLRKVVRRLEKERAKEQGGMFWCTGWRGWSRMLGESAASAPSTPPTKTPRRSSHSLRRGSTARDGSIPARKSRTASIIHEDNNSRSSSRHSTDTDSSRPRAGSATRIKRTSSSRVATIGSTTRQTRSTRLTEDDEGEDEASGSGGSGGINETKSSTTNRKEERIRDISPHTKETQKEGEASSTTTAATTKAEEPASSSSRPSSRKTSLGNLSDISTASDHSEIDGSVKDGEESGGNGAE